MLGAARVVQACAQAGALQSAQDEAGCAADLL